MTNVDRTPRNPNLLWWHGRLWLIDHGAALYLQHGTDDLPALARRPFPLIAQHVLLPYAGSIAAADARLAPLLTPALVEAVVERRAGRVARRRRRRGRAPRLRRVPAAAARGARAASRRRPMPPAGADLEPDQFAYAILRVVPRVERGEQLNAGVVLFCRRRRFLAARVDLDERRLAALAPDLDPRTVRAHLDALAADRGRRPGRRGGRGARARPSASAGSSPRRARSSSRRRCTPGYATTRRRCSTGSSTSSWRRSRDGLPTSTAPGARRVRARRGRRLLRRLRREVEPAGMAATRSPTASRNASPLPSVAVRPVAMRWASTTSSWSRSGYISGRTGWSKTRSNQCRARSSSPASAAATAASYSRQSPPSSAAASR